MAHRGRNPSSYHDGPPHYDHQHAHALPFAGRIGGNLEFCKMQDPKTPDATKLTNLRDVIDIRGFGQPIYMRAAVVECVGTGLQVFVGGLIDAAFGKYISTSSPLGWTCAHAVTTWVIISLFLFAAAPASGGHLNPFITIATFCAGLCTLPRMIYYVVGQMVGAVAGAWWLKLGLAGSTYYFPTGIIGGCTIDFAQISPGQAYALELGAYLVVVFLAFGVGLDPRQGQVFGPALSPILVGLVVALASFGTGNVRPGWYGASINPARCSGLLAAKEHTGSNWVAWVAAITASVLNGIIYSLVPPHHQSKATPNFGSSQVTNGE